MKENGDREIVNHIFKYHPSDKRPLATKKTPLEILTELRESGECKHD
jgi:hypothetical protein